MNTEHGYDSFILTFVGIFAFLALLGSAGLAWSMGVDWLVEHQVLVSAEQDPVLMVPGGEGAGLDVPRMALLGGVLFAVLAIAVSSAVRAAQRRARVQ